jgi:hypothetical protein
MDLYLVPDTNTSTTLFMTRFIVSAKQEYCHSEWPLDAIYGSKKVIKVSLQLLSTRARWWWVRNWLGLKKQGEVVIGGYHS